jgi:hypothetical protein
MKLKKKLILKSNLKKITIKKIMIKFDKNKNSKQNKNNKKQELNFI